MQNLIKDENFKIIKNVVVRNLEVEKNFYDLLTIVNSEEFGEIHDFEGFDKVVVSGPDLFKKEVLERSGVCIEDLEKIVFL